MQTPGFIVKSFLPRRAGGGGHNNIYESGCCPDAEMTRTPEKCREVYGRGYEREEREESCFLLLATQGLLLLEYAIQAVHLLTPKEA